MSQYLDSDTDLVDKFVKRHELKEEFLANYISDFKNTYPTYPDAHLRKLAHDNLVSHSPEFLEKLDNKYPISDTEYKKLAKAYLDFKDDFKYLFKKDVLNMENELKKLNEDFNFISKIPAEKDLEKYLLDKFNIAQKNIKVVKSSSEILENDLNTEKYINKNNLLKNITLSSETKLEYEKELTTQNDLLNKIINIELDMQKYDEQSQEFQDKLEKLKHSKSDLANIYTTENVINNVAEIVDDYTNNFVKPLEDAKREFEEYKKSQEEALIPYKRPTLFSKIIGFFQWKKQTSK